MPAAWAGMQQVAVGQAGFSSFRTATFLATHFEFVLTDPGSAHDGLLCRCALRWYLSHYNYRLKGNWAWFPTGTYIVNMLGTAIDFGLQVRSSGRRAVGPC